MRNIKIVISYDGTDFAGWQTQKNHRTVQGELEKALTRMHKHQVSIVGAGRTDSGVHALGQVANFFTDLDSISEEQFTPALNSFLPSDIRVRESVVVPNDFHSRYDARIRVYCYYLYISSVSHPIYRRYSLRVYPHPDIAVLNRMARCFLGDKDFTSFSSKRDTNPSKRRTVYAASFFPEGRYIVFQIAANAFLWKMVRTMVGTLLGYEQRGIDASEVNKLLEQRDRTAAGVTAPGWGLFLEKIVYKGEENFSI